MGVERCEMRSVKEKCHLIWLVRSIFRGTVGLRRDRG